VIISGTFAVAATRDEAWRQLSDLPALVPLLPGCDTIQAEGEGVYRVGATATVGPIKTRLEGTVQVGAAEAPESMRLRVEGRDAITASHVRAAILFTLAAPTPTETAVAYEADVLVSGRLGTIGQGLLRQTVATLLEEFVRRLDARMKGEPLRAASTTRLGVTAAARTLRDVIQGQRGNGE
jgi:carbon monoxide dehydrogenase subunit G